MKINVDIECTPDEARRVMGLPDFTPLHDKYIETLKDSMNGNVSSEVMENLMKSWAPMGDAGMTFWRKLFESAGK
ncbi:DUF6489 family protein [Sphingomonas immobilis]|uniref:DUF6489 family protein n=1 Tax=Sphingomonas immobilis TaxID=3063997 RepID=A0ABT8ZV07_9SPHN|nr:DUF6489 family protein [Sphingomonas sp. CA1-15]MDO7841410.1 DUF6489 family protein [Sphingomonas sp. CA1-15]